MSIISLDLTKTLQRYIRTLLAVCLVGAILLPPPVMADDSLVVGIFPRRNATDTMRMFTPLVEYLSSKLGRKVRLVTSKDFKSFWKGVLEQRYDIVHYNQLNYIQSHKEVGYQVILKNAEFGHSTIAGAIATRKDTGITSIKQLKGKKIVFGGGRSAMMSYIVPTALLRKAGLKQGDYTEEFARNPPNALLAGYFGQADAAGVGDVAVRLPIVTSKIDTSKMVFLATSKPMAHLPWATKQSMHPALRTRIQSILANLSNTEEGRRILKQAALTDLVVAKDSEYDPHRKLIRQVLGKEY